MTPFWIGMVVLGVTVGQVQGGQPAPDKPGTLAHELLAVEMGGAPTPDQAQVLDYFIRRAVAEFGGLRAGEPEEARARRFFQSVDTALIEARVIFPPAGHVELLSQALTPRVLSEAEFRQAGNQLANARRRGEFEAGYRSGAKFFFFDCDLASVLYVSVGEKLGLPVSMVELP